MVQWMRLLSKELAQRIEVDRTAWGRRATKLTLQIINPGDRCEFHVRRGSAFTLRGIGSCRGH